MSKRKLPNLINFGRRICYIIIIDRLNIETITVLLLTLFSLVIIMNYNMLNCWNVSISIIIIITINHVVELY